MANMLFHYPAPMRDNAASGSQVRPKEMLCAFRRLGYSVEVVSGYGVERAASIKRIKADIKNGKTFDFVYSEALTEPTVLSDRDHLPRYPLLDSGFFSFCREQGIPIGLFYRDIYWRFPLYRKNVGFVKAMIAKVFYWYDLIQYRRHVNVLYLPSLEMAKHVPLIKREAFRALPPGHDICERPAFSPGRPLRLLYVGGIGDHYRLEKIFEAILDMPDVQFTLCTRHDEWEAAKIRYPTAVAANVSVVHRTGTELVSLYSECDIAMLFVEPQPYWGFAVPIKLFEYVGWCKPIIASMGTFAGRFVSGENIGWEVPYSVESLRQLLHSLLEDASLVEQKQARVSALAPAHNWVQRAAQVVQQLTTLP